MLVLTRTTTPHGINKVSLRITSYLRHGAPANRSCTISLNYIMAPDAAAATAGATGAEDAAVAIESLSLKCTSSLSRNLTLYIHLHSSC